MIPFTRSVLIASSVHSAFVKSSWKACLDVAVVKSFKSFSYILSTGAFEEITVSSSPVTTFDIRFVVEANADIGTIPTVITPANNKATFFFMLFVSSL